MYPELTDEQIGRVVDTIRQFFALWTFALGRVDTRSTSHGHGSSHP
jgi:hypothetical protein